MERGHLKILLIEDERALAMVLTRFLSEEGWHVDWASNGALGLEIAKRDDFALVILDVMLPGTSGWEILKELRAQRPSIPILMTSGLDDIDDRVKALKTGADDYVVKPYELRELAARVGSLIRRDHLSRDLVTRVADLSLDRKTRRVTRQGRVIRLTRREYDLLEALASNEGCPLDRETLQRRVWTDNEAFDQTVDVFVGTLKQKVDLPFGNDLIHASDGGYVLGEEPDCDECPDPRELVA